MRYAKAMVLSSAVCAAGLSILSSTASAAVIAQYNFDTLTNGNKTVADVSGNGHHVNWNNAVTPDASDPFNMGNSSSVKATNTTGTAASPGTVNLSNSGRNQVTVEGWIMPLAQPTSGETPLVRIDAANNVRITLRMDSGGNAAAYVALGQSGTPATATLTGGALKVGEWNYLALTYGGNIDGRAKLYVKNSQYATLTKVAELNLGLALPSSLTALYVGYSTNVGATAFFDDIRISDTVLEGKELGYNTSFTPEPASMSLLWLGGLLLGRRRRKA